MTGERVEFERGLFESCFDDDFSVVCEKLRQRGFSLWRGEGGDCGEDGVEEGPGLVPLAIDVAAEPNLVF